MARGRWRVDLPGGAGPWLAGAIALGSAILLGSLGSRVSWPEPVVVRVANETPRSVLVDARWWYGELGVEGPIVRDVPAGGVTMLHARRVDGICVRVIHRSHRHVAGVFLEAPLRGDTVRAAIRDRAGEGGPVLEPGPACPPELLEHRVRLGSGRYFDPADPETVGRERVLRRF